MTLRVERALGLVTVQDLGRPGRMHEGLAPGGALVPGLLVAANQALGNADGLAAIEVCGRLEVVATAACVVATPLRHVLAPGQRLTVMSEPRRVAYLALAGGVAAPWRLGGRATQLSAGLGSALGAGALLTASGLAHAPPPAAATARTPRVEPGPAAIGVVPGPDLDALAADAIAALCAAPYQVSPRSDRVGTRLVGAPLARRPGPGERPRPLVRGAIEVPADGAPVVLGPEHPTTGGYPVIAVVRAADLDAFFATRPGGTVRFFAVAAPAAPATAV